MERFLSMLLFVTVTTATPGPNNLMVLASGANFGLRRTVPHIVGIALGFGLMVLAVGVGLGTLFDRFPELHSVLKWIAFAYLLWLAWRMANARAPVEGKVAGARPLSFLGAAAFQWVNPKAWVMAVSTAPLFTTADGNHVVEISQVAGLFALVTLPSCALWCLFGTWIARLLNEDRHQRWFNIAMAVLLVVSVAPVLFE
jgi:threonine/homoserine/homoserine lactone efflux protein